MTSPLRKRKKNSSQVRLPESTISLWLATAGGPEFPSLQGDIEVDVAIVGAGITGITAALLLKRAGKRVALLEKNRIVAGETGHTTAHLTEVTDIDTQTVISDFGTEAARLVYASMREALDRIARFVNEERIACHFRRVPAYIYTERDSDLEWLKEEADVAGQMGLDCTFTRDVPLPFSHPRRGDGSRPGAVPSPRVSVAARRLDRGSRLPCV